MSKSGGGALSDYVQNGLIGHWDGIEHGAEPTKWTCLKTSLDFNLSGGAFDSNSYVKNQSSDYCQANISDFNSQIQSQIANDTTLEVTFEGIIFNSKCGILGATAPCLLMIYNNGLFYVRQTNDYGYKWPLDNTTIHLMSANGVSFMKNGQMLTQGNKDYWGVNNVRIGARDSNYSPVGHFYSVRIYNRALTQQEMLRNQRNDNIRFNLGLTI